MVRTSWQRYMPSRKAGIIMGCTIGTAVGIILVQAFTTFYEYTWPVTKRNLTELDDVFVEDGFIKVPVNITRNKDCLGNTTVLVRRQHDYGTPLGLREDLIVIGLYNTPVTEIGLHKEVLWFEIPPNLPPGRWQYSPRIQDDCGGLFGLSPEHPTRPVIGRDLVIPERGASR